MFFAIPDEIKKYVVENNTVKAFSNFGLVFQKFYPYDSPPGDKGIDHKNSNDRLSGYYNKNKDTKNSALEEKARQQQDFLLSRARLFSTGKQEENILELSTRLQSRLITGIGEVSPGEVGVVLDHNTGLPYIPAASIKGAVRAAYTINFARKHPEAVSSGKIEEAKVDGLKTVFGSLDAKDAFRGGFVFMDSYSTKVPDLAPDVMTPHFTKYYSGKDDIQLIETEDPKPISFLSVKSGEEFTFRGYFLTDCAKEYRDEILEAFNTVFTELGLGAKTSAGYGRFQKCSIEDSSKRIADAIEKKIKEEHPEQAFASKITQCGNWGEFRQTLENEPEVNKGLLREEMVVSAIKTKADEGYLARPDKWDLERTKKVNEWLEPAGEKWAIPSQEKTDEPAKKTASVTQKKEAGLNEALKLLSEITNFKHIGKKIIGKFWEALDEDDKKELAAKIVEWLKANDAVEKLKKLPDLKPYLH